MKRLVVVIILAFTCLSVWAAGSKEASASSAGRGRYLAGRGVIIPPEEVKIDSYVAAVNYQYPNPQDLVGVQLYTGHKQVSAEGQEEVIQIGIQARETPYEELPPMNLAFVIDKSSSMSDSDKIGWVKKGFALFLGKVRDFDYVSLVVFDDEARVVFPSTRMSSPVVRERFRQAVDSLTTGGGSNMLEGLTLGYQEVMTNYRSEYTNRVIFLSDGTEFSGRLRGAKAKSGNLRFSLLWDNYNDLDLHVLTPRGEVIYYAHRTSTDYGELDVDMNASGRKSTKPVENIYWAGDSAPDGIYEVSVRYFADHEGSRKLTSPYTIEVFNNGEISHHEGAFDVSEEKGTHFVARINHRTMKASGAAGIYAIAERYKEVGINISTIGVGLEFDMDLMTRLAEVGGGSSRFISDEAEAVKTFDTDFDRMVVPAARDCRMTLTLSPEIKLLGTWGYNHSVNGNVVTYELSTLHQRDYETILAHVLIPPTETFGSRSLGTFAVTYTDLLGGTRTMDPVRIDTEVADDPAPVTGFSDGMVLRSGTMLHFAQAIREIGLLYYASPQGNPNPEKLNQAIDRTVEMRNELKNAELRLGKPAFKNEVDILEKYLQILGTDIKTAGGDASRVAQSGELTAPALDRGLSERLARLFREISLEVEAKTKGVVAVSGFAMKGTQQPPLVGLLNESAVVELSKATSLQVVERERLNGVMNEQKLSLSDLMDTTKAVSVGKLLSAQYILTGSVIEMPSTVVIFARIVNVETGEVESAAQVIVPKSREVSALL